MDREPGELLDDSLSHSTAIARAQREIHRAEADNDAPLAENYRAQAVALYGHRLKLEADYRRVTEMQP